MFKKILLPLDGSENAEAAIPWVRIYGGPSKAEVVLLRVVEERSIGNGPSAKEERAEAEEYLQGIHRELNFRGIPAKTVVVSGTAALSILEVAEEEKCDLILMTTRGASKVSRWRLGGVTQQLMRLSPIPVMVVRSQTPLKRQGRVQRVIVPLDGSKLSKSILPLAERLARAHKARLILLHVAPPSLDPMAVREYEAFRKKMIPYCASVRERGVKVFFRRAYGDPAAQIVEAAEPGDILAMTTHGYGGFKRWIFGSVAEKIIQESDVPIFIYKGIPTPRVVWPAMSDVYPGPM